jgi:hypothetical protein
MVHADGVGEGQGALLHERRCHLPEARQLGRVGRRRIVEERYRRRDLAPEFFLERVDDRIELRQPLVERDLVRRARRSVCMAIPRQFAKNADGDELADGGMRHAAHATMLTEAVESAGACRGRFSTF